jgi:hypothetical protein
VAPKLHKILYLISARDGISSGPARALRVEGFEILDLFVTFSIKGKSKWNEDLKFKSGTSVV